VNSKRTLLRVALGVLVVAGIAAWVARGRQPIDDWRAIARAGHYVGPANAAVIVTQFSDMTCGHCRELAGSLKRLHDSVPALGISFRHAVLVPDAVTIAAARALVCAEAQDRFWPMYQLLAGRPLENPSGPYFVSLANATALDRPQFLRCINSPKTVDRIDRDAHDARLLGIEATPLLLVNGFLVRGNPPYDDLLELIREAQHK
jgi:protein-disulfide isomerase